METAKYSIVVPVYNEEESIPDLVKQLREVMDLLDGPAEVVLVDDGSRDASYQLMAAASEEDPRIKVLQLSRNFGHQVAITAGMDFASGRAVVDHGRRPPGSTGGHPRDGSAVAGRLRDRVRRPGAQGG